MLKKQNKVTLKASGVESEFDLEHAERILRMQNNGGWELPNNSKFQFSLENGITRKVQKSSKGTE